MTAQQLKEQPQKTGGTDQIFVPQENESFTKSLKESFSLVNRSLKVKNNSYPERQTILMKFTAYAYTHTNFTVCNLG